MPYLEAEKQLLNGDIDAMFIVYSFNTPIVQNLIKSQHIHIFDFKLADAYIKKNPNLEKVIIPRGAFDIERLLPRQEINLLSASITLLVDKQLHPAIQWAFILAARQNSRNESHFFSRPGEYPKDVDYDSIPLSPVAERYYSNGIPQVFSSFPIWLASLIDGIWIKALAFFILIYPILIKVLSIRSFASKKVLNQSHAFLRFLKIEGMKTKSATELEAILRQIDAMLDKHKTIWCTTEDAKDYIELTYLARDIKTDLQERLELISHAKSK